MNRRCGLVLTRGFGKKTRKAAPIEDVETDPLLTFKRDAHSAVDSLNKSLEGVQARRANPALLTGIDVEGQPLQHIAHVAVRDPRTLVVTPHDADMASVVLAAINNASLGLNASLDKGALLRVPVPRASDDLRQKLKRKVAEAEEIATSKIRLARQAMLKELRQGAFSKDELRKLEKDLDGETSKVNAELDKATEAKRKEIEK